MPSYSIHFGHGHRCIRGSLLLALATTLTLLFIQISNGQSTIVPVTLPDTLASSPTYALAHSGTAVLSDLGLHPTQRYAPYLPAQQSSDAQPSTTYAKFYTLLDLYAKRYGEDDNFTLRVVNNQTDELLELYVLEEQRDQLMKTGQADWQAIDRLRSKHTRRLVDKYAETGIPRGAITIKWGRMNQVFEARNREEAYIEYELQLARRHGLSAMATELGTVETFNRDDMVSSVGARGRYQFMPAHLKRVGVQTYTLSTTGGGQVTIREEHHPLLLMEEAFILIRGYSNAVGHELPGLSAYHAGPSNIFRIYRIYLQKTNPNLHTQNVLDAYTWGITDGFGHVSRNSSFKNQSRAYLSSAYGAFRAVEHLPLDFSKTVRAELVTLRQGPRVALSTLLTVLQKHAPNLDWGPGSTDNLYENFRKLNPHLPLIPSPSARVFVPKRSNLVFRSGKTPVRFFLPVGTSEALKAENIGYFDDNRLPNL